MFAVLSRDELLVLFYSGQHFRFNNNCNTCNNHDQDDNDDDDN